MHGLSCCGLLAGKQVLVAGATSGAGVIAVQLAHASSACVTALVSAAEHAALMEEYGADQVVADAKIDAGLYGRMMSSWQAQTS